jgi:tetratricopeptide (TPR) repeat protein
VPWLAVRFCWSIATEVRKMGRRVVSIQSSKYLLVIMLAGVLGPMPARMFGQPAAAPSSNAPQKNWKDRAEYDLYASILADTNPKTKLEKLQRWEKDYPMTEWIAARRTLFLTTYVALNDAKNAADAAKQILADDPKDFTALYYTMLFTQGLYTQNQSPDVLDQGEKAAKAILENIDTPPPNVKAEDWAKLRPDIEVLAHVNLGFIAMQRKNWDGAEAEFQKVLMTNPDNAQVDYWMGTVIASEKKLDKLPAAMFYFARAATIQGKTPLTPDAQKTALTYVQKQYKNFHGSDEGFNDLLTAAKSNPTPPAGFSIKNANEIAQASAASEEEYNKNHPSEALWANLKMALTGPEGQMYFDMNMKGAEIPTILKGRVIKLEPAVKPKTILLAMEDKSNNTTTADATLKFEMPLAGKVDEGTELSFHGVADSYTANPFMVVFTVEKDKLQGWTGKNAPASTRTHKPAASQ